MKIIDLFMSLIKSIHLTKESVTNCHGEKIITLCNHSFLGPNFNYMVYDIVKFKLQLV